MNANITICYISYFVYREEKHFETTQELIQHLNASHGHTLKIESDSFKNWEEFEKLKECEEKIRKSWCVKRRGDRRTKQHKTSWFYCNRTGDFETKGTGKRAIKSQGSSKTGCSCPAFVTARTGAITGEVTAEFCLAHVGHREEITHSRISKEMRPVIEAKLAQSVNMNAIMDFIRDSQGGPLIRDHLTTRLDLHNIKHQYSISCM